MEKELKEKFEKLNNYEDVLALAKENNIDLSEEEAKEFIYFNNKNNELNDEELVSIGGGYGGLSKDQDSGDTPKYHYGQKVILCGFKNHRVTIGEVSPYKCRVGNSLQWRYAVEYESSFMEMFGTRWHYEYELSEDWE